MRDYSVLDNLEEGVQIISPDFRYIYLNKVLLDEIKLSCEAVIGHKMNDHFPGIVDTSIYAEITKTLNEKAITKVINEFKFPDGRIAFYELKMQPIEEGAIIFSRDITKTQKGMQLLLETNSELEQFAFVSAHNLREPIKLIESFSDLLLTEHKDNLSREVLDVCDRIYSKAKLSLQLINEFRDLSGIGAAKISKENFAIVDMAKMISNPLILDYPNKKIEIRFPQNDSNVFAYKSLVSILLRHLFKNVIDYGQDKLSFQIEDKEKQVFSLANMTGDDAKNIDVFSAEFILERSHYSPLGRAICKKVINQHGGKIWSEQNGREFKVYFQLPLVKTEDIYE